MDKSLSVELNKDKEITFVEQSQNILNNISQAFSNAVKKGTELIEFPDNIGASIKDGIEKMDLKEIGASAVESALKSGMKSLGMKSSTFNSLKNIFDA